MTDQPLDDLDNLFDDTNQSAEAQERRAILAARLAVALDTLDDGAEDPLESPERMATYLDGGMDDAERAVIHGQLLGSAEARANLQSGSDLVEMTAQSSLRPPVAVQAQALALFAPEPKPAPVPSPSLWAQIRRQVTLPRFTLAAAGAFAIAVVAIGPARQLASPSSQMGSAPTEMGAVSGQPGDNSEMPALPVSEAKKGWGAVALSPTTNAVAIIGGQISKEVAKQKALAACGRGGAQDCVLGQSGQNVCYAVAAPANGEKSSATGSTIGDARMAALRACGQGNTGLCQLVIAGCGD